MLVRVYDEGPMEQKLIDRFEVSEIQELNESMKQKQAMKRFVKDQINSVAAIQLCHPLTAR